MIVYTENGLKPINKLTDKSVVLDCFYQPTPITIQTSSRICVQLELDGDYQSPVLPVKSYINTSYGRRKIGSLAVGDQLVIPINRRVHQIKSVKVGAKQERITINDDTCRLIGNGIAGYGRNDQYRRVVARGIPDWCLFLPHYLQIELLCGAFLGEGYFESAKVIPPLSVTSALDCEKIKFMLARINWSFISWGKRDIFTVKLSGLQPNQYNNKYYLVTIRNIRKMGRQTITEIIPANNEYILTTCGEIKYE